MRALPAAAAALLASCAAGPDYERPEPGLPAAYAGAATVPAPLPVPHNWWTLYGDATLDALVQAGLAHNADVQLAAARVEESAAALREVGASLYPALDASAEASRQRLPGQPEQLYTLGASASFELDLWGRLRRTRSAAREALLASRHAQGTVALTLTGAIARGYFAARSLDAQTLASADTLRAAEESLALARKRADAGVSSELDLHQAESLRAAAAAQAKEIARQRAAVLHQLGALTGQLQLALDPSPLQALPEPPLPPPGVPSQLLTRRPDVRQAEAQLAAATHAIGAARAAQFPALRLTAFGGAQSEELGTLLTAGGEVWSVGGGLLGPIFHAGRYAARTEQAVARARQAEARYLQAARNAFRDVADALSNVQLARAADADLQNRVVQAQHALRLATRRYETGYSAYLEVLDAQRTVNDAQLSFLRNRQAYLAYTVDLMTALGGGWNPE